MPWGDCTGPWWASERGTAGGFGRWGTGLGYRRGGGRGWFGARWNYNPVEELHPGEEQRRFLEDRISFLENELKRAKNQLENLGK